MKLLTALIATSLALSLNAGSSENLASDKVHDSKPDHKEPGGKETGKPDKDRDRDKDDHHDPDDCDDDRHDHGKPKPPKPPKPPKEDATVPAAPTQLIAEAVSEFQVNLTWMDNSTNELGFKIERSLDGTNYAQVAQVLPNTTVYRDLNRFPDTKYFYRARAFNAKGDSAHSNQARTQTPAPECRLSLMRWGDGVTAPSCDQTEMVAIAAGAYQNVVLTADGTVFDLGQGVEAAVPSLTNIIAIAAGGGHALALKVDGTVTGWGNDYQGQASPPSNATNMISIAAGGSHSLGLKSDGTVVAWGNNQWLQARPPGDLNGVVAIAGGQSHSLALRSDGVVIGWGHNDQLAAQPPAELRNVVAIAAGFSHSLALKNDGTVVGWGTSDAAIVPTNLTGIVGITAGEHYSVALKNDGTLAYWGSGLARFGSFLTELTRVVAMSAGYQNNNLLLTSLPSAPTSMSATTVASNQVQLAWTDVSDSETEYLVMRDALETNGNQIVHWELIATLAAEATNFLDNSVAFESSYWYSVRTKGICGGSVSGAETSVRVAPPTAPPYFSLVEARGDKAILNWLGNDVGVIEYRIERAADAQGQPGDWTEIARIPPQSPWANAYSDSGLSANTTNWYRFRAVNGLGVSPFSEPRSVIIALPPAPRYLAANLLVTNGVHLSWACDYWYDEAGFKIERALDMQNSPGPWTEIGMIPMSTNAASEFIDPTAWPERTYWYRIRVFNPVGLSDYSTPLSVELILPSAVNLYAEPFSNLVFLVVSAPAPFSSFPIRDTRFERATDLNGVPGDWQVIAPVPMRNGFVALDLGLAANTIYWYRAKVFTWLGASTFSIPISTTLVPPQPPHQVTARIGNTNRISLRWQAHVKNNIWLGELGFPQEQATFKIERAIETASGPVDWIEIGTVGQTNSYYYSFEDHVAGAGSAFRYRVSACNVAGQSMPVESFPVQLIPPPTPQLGAYPFVATVSLYWNSFSSGAVGFRLERAPDLQGAPGSWDRIATFPLEQNPFREYEDALPPVPSRHWYRVQAYNWLGDSDFCAPVSALIQPPQAPAFLHAKIGSTNQIALVWAHTGSDATAFHIERAQSVNGGLSAWEEIIRLTASEARVPDAFVGIDSNALANADYVYRIRATNSIGSSPYSGPLAVSVVPPPPLTTLQTSVFGGRVHLSWNSFHSYHDYGEVSGFEIERALDNTGMPGTWTPIAFAYDYTFVDSSPPPNSTCWYRVRTVNWVGGSEYVGPNSVTIVPPAAPSFYQVFVGNTNQVELSWIAAAPYDQDGFVLEFANDNAGLPGTWEQVAVVGATNRQSASFTQTNAVAFATNWYRLRAFSAAGESINSETLQFVVAPPPAPTELSASQFADRLRLAWRTDTLGEVGGFAIDRAPDHAGSPGPWLQIAVAPATNSFCGWWYSSHEDSGLTVDTTYWYRVRAFNWVGDSESSTSLTHMVSGPTAPYIINAWIGTTNEVLVSWFPGYADVEGYELERAPDAGGVPGAWSLLETVLTSNLSLEFIDTNLTWYATNWYRVRAFNALGVSAYSYSLAVGVVPPPPPVVYEAKVFANQVRLKWYSPAANYGTIVGNKVERAPDAGSGPGEWTEIENVPAENIWWGTYHETIDTNLSANATYWYRFRSYNWLGDGIYSPTTNLTIVPPGAPEDLVAHAYGVNYIQLFWDAVAPQDQNGFKLERRTDVQPVWAEIAIIPGPNVYRASYIDTNFIPNIANHYRVRAFNIVGDSPYSTTTSATIQLPGAQIVGPNLPQILSLTLTNHDVLLTWSASGGTTNVVEAADDLHEAFAPISPDLIFDGVGSVTTNFLDAGTLTNSASRFYRIRVVP